MVKVDAVARLSQSRPSDAPISRPHRIQQSCSILRAGRPSSSNVFSVDNDGTVTKGNLLGQHPSPNGLPLQEPAAERWRAFRAYNQSVFGGVKRLQTCPLASPIVLCPGCGLRIQAFAGPLEQVVHVCQKLHGVRRRTAFVIQQTHDDILLGQDTFGVSKLAHQIREPDLCRC